MPKTFAAPAAFNEPSEQLDIALTPVSSNQVAAVGYDQATNTLAVTFTRGPGHTYQYPNVSPELHNQFMEAESKGSFFGTHIKPLPFKKFSAAKAD
jgi:hypothetical protein